MKKQIINKAAIAVASFFIYLFLYALGSHFNVQFGYASAFWPISGVMLGLYFLFGLPVLIGSFTSFIYLQFDGDLSNFSLLTVLFSSLAVIHLMVCKVLVKFSCQLPIDINKPMNIIKFLMLTGPLSSLIISFIYVLCLWYFNAVPADNLLYIGAIKWIGDFMSIVFLTPVFLSIYPNYFVKRTKRSAAAVLTSLFVYSVISSIFLLFSHNEFKEKEQQFITQVAPFVEQLNIAQTKIKHHLTSLDGLFQASEHVDRAEFNAFTKKLNITDSSIRAIGWLPLVPKDNRERFENKLMAEGFDNYKLRKLTSTGMQIAPIQEYYLPIYYIEPFDLNAPAVGLDVVSHPIVSNSVHKAIHSRTFAISPLLSLAQQLDKFTGVVVYYPIYKLDKNNEKELLIGLVEVVFEIDRLLGDLYKKYGTDGFTYSLVYGNENKFVQKEVNHNSFLSYAEDIDVFDNHGVLTFYSTPKFELGLINWTHIWVMFAACFIGVICVMFVFFIITFNSNLTRKVKASTAELLKTNNELVAANEAKNLFLANISHEYRTPLNAIVGFTEIATRETQDEKMKEYLSKIDDASTLLLNIVNDVLDLSKMQAGELTLESRAFQPSAITNSVIEMFNNKADEKGIYLHCQFDESYHTWVDGDSLRFKQIIINLLNNALKFTNQGGITIKGSCVSKLADRCLLTLQVIDTGIGIKSEDQERLFSSFAQAESSTTRKYGGTGLGLSIVKQLCCLMGGDISLDSKVGKGSCFTATLSLLKAKNTEQTKDNIGTLKELNEHKLYQGKHVLVVEDNKINQMVVQKQLTSLGLTCDLADDGVLALQYLENNTADIILMDIQMPNMDGFTAAKLIKQNPQLAHIPIAILSASVGKKDKAKANELAIYDFINKPFRQTDLESVLTNLLK